MPFFQGATGTITMTGCRITDVKGDMHHYDHSHHVNNWDSNNNITQNTTDSYDNSSTVKEGKRNTYNPFTEDRVISEVFHTTIRGKNRSSPLAAGILHTSPRRADRNAATPTERARQLNLEGREHGYWAPRRENGPARLLEESQSRTHDNAEYQWAGNYESAESVRQPNLEEREYYEYQRRPAPARRPNEHSIYDDVEHPWQEIINYEPAERVQRQDSEDEPHEPEDYPAAPAKHSAPTSRKRSREASRRNAKPYARPRWPDTEEL